MSCFRWQILFRFFLLSFCFKHRRCFCVSSVPYVPTQRWHFSRFKQDKIFYSYEYKLSGTSRSYVIKCLHDCLLQPFLLFFYTFSHFKVVYYGFLGKEDESVTSCVESVNENNNVSNLRIKYSKIPKFN